MDSGLFYGRQRARRVLSDVLVGGRGPPPVTAREKRFIVSSNEDGSKGYTSCSLFDISLLFVAENIVRVDSLLDFPEPMGLRLFALVLKINTFVGDLAPKALQVFDDAYGEMLLKSLCLRHRAPVLVKRMEEVKSFHSLTSLDLHGCELGDEHSIFQHLTSPLLASLVQLFIGGNGLSDAGLQRLTAPVRIMHSGLAQLQLLDVSCNPISRNALRYLTCLPQLVTLDVSDTDMKLNTRLTTTVWELLGLMYSEEPLDVFEHSKCRTQGWAEPVVRQWESLEMPEQRKDKVRVLVQHSFGSLPSRKEGGTPELEEGKTKSLHFYKTNHQIDQQCSSHTHQGLNVFDKKRKRDTRHRKDSQSPETSQPSSLTTEDMDLLNSY